jgi:hypothetical protein
MSMRSAIMTRVRRPFLFAGAIAASLVIGSPLCGNADPTIAVPVTPTGAVGPPVEIDECKLLYSGNDVAGVSSGVYLKFTNDSTLTADLINFKVAAGSESGIIRDVGTFTPGIEITHQYREGSGHMMFSPLLSHVSLDCAVASVHFKNGTVWQAASMKPPAPSPTPVALTAPRPIDYAPDSLSFAGLGAQYARYVSLYDATGIGAVHESGTCAHIVSVKAVDVSRRSAALRVSPIASGTCSMVLADAANNAIAIPVSVAGMPRPEK